MSFMFAKFKKEIIDYLFMFHSDIQNIVYLARYNRLDLFEIVYSETDAFNGIDQVVDYASLNGNLEIVRYLTAIGASCSTYAMDYAARSGHLDIVQWLHLNRSEGCTTEAMDWAALIGHLDVVKWLHLNRSESFSAFAIKIAARNGHVNVVKCLVENSLVTDRESLRFANECANTQRYTEIKSRLN